MKFHRKRFSQIKWHRLIDPVTEKETTILGGYFRFLYGKELTVQIHNTHLGKAKIISCSFTALVVVLVVVFRTKGGAQFYLVAPGRPWSSLDSKTCIRIRVQDLLRV